MTKQDDKRYDELKEYVEEVNDRMNNDKREDALFKVLEVPNDELRLEVVKCLLRIDLS